MLATDLYLYLWNVNPPPAFGYRDKPKSGIG